MGGFLPDLLINRGRECASPLYTAIRSPAGGKWIEPEG
jgi:hypothetical protein